MNHEQREALKELQAFLNIHVRPPQIHHQDVGASEADMQWDAARFCATLLYHTELPRSLSRNDLEDFRRRYETVSGSVVALEQMFEEFWLREVLGSVQIPSGIDSIINRYAEVRDLKEELLFLRTLPQPQKFENNISLNAVELETAIVAYEETHSVSLNRSDVQLKRWAEVKDGKITFIPIDNHYGLLLDYWDRLDFLYQWKNSWPDDECGLQISIANLAAVVREFDHFSEAPTISGLISQRVIKIIDQRFYVDFFDTEPSYMNELADRVAGFFWEMLVNDASLVNNEVRLHHFLAKALLWNTWPRLLHHVTSAAATSFLQASMSVVLAQKDLIGINEEFDKIRLDSAEYRGWETLYRYPSYWFEERQIQGNNLFELYQSLAQLERNSSSTYLNHQPARDGLTFLIRTLVEFDQEYAQPGVASTEYFGRVTQLLRTGLQAPFLLWTTATFISANRPEIIPHLLVHQDTNTLALSLLDKVVFAEDAANLNHLAWTRSVSLLLMCLPDANNSESSTSIATTLFQLFRQLNRNKYILLANLNPAGEEISRRKHQEKERDVLKLLEAAPGFNGRFIGGQAPYLLPIVFESLASHFISFHAPIWKRNATTQFPLLQWDGMFWLLKIDGYWQYKNTAQERKTTVVKIVNAFANQYSGLIEMTEKVAYSHEEMREKAVLPIWSEKIERLELLDWFYIIYAIAQSGNLGAFIAPRFQFEPTSDRYHKTNQFTTDKLRTHFGVLLQALKALITNSNLYAVDKGKLAAAKTRIEAQVIEYINKHLTSVPEQGRVDLFSYNSEWMFQQTGKEALLPKLAQSINWFQDKRSLIEAILSSKDLIKWLLLLDYITAEGIRNAIVEQISKEDITAFLQNLNWLPEVQTVLVKIAQYPELLHKFEEALKYWETLVKTRDTLERQVQLFRSRLLLAYFKKDAEAINDVPIPTERVHTSSTMSYQEQKDFYRGLLSYDEDPERGYNIFNGLANRYKDDPVLGMNRMVAKMRLAEKSDRIDLYKEAYEEWQHAKDQNYGSNDMAYLEPNLSANVLEILFHTHDFLEQEKIFAQLDVPTRMFPAVLTTRVRSLIEERKRADAVNLIEEAKVYHQFADYSNHQFLQDLELEAKGLDSIDDLKIQFNRIFGSAPSKLITILPDAWNDKKDLHSFLVQEIVNASGKLLEKIRSIEEINLEDKYNDLIELVLDARLNRFGWQIGSQNRGAFSTPADGSAGTQPGERDIPIFDSNKNMLLNCEALIYRGASNTPSHLQKVFNSHHQKSAFVILLYDTAVVAKGFEENWKEYMQTHVRLTHYPAGAELSADIKDISNEFGCSISAIKVGRSEHGGHTSLYHVFVNINYHSQLPHLPKKPRKVKDSSSK